MEKKRETPRQINGRSRTAATSSGSSRNGNPTRREAGHGGHPDHRKPGMKTTPAHRGAAGHAAPRKAAPATMEGLEARRVALRVIRQVTEADAYASLALDEALSGSGLSAVDRRLVSRLVYDTLDHLIYLDTALSQVMAREDTDIKPRNILGLGACQILLEDRIPESAATNTAVQLCAELGMEGLKGVCNGILRNLVRRKDSLVFPDPVQEPDQAHAVEYSLPLWLWQRLSACYGEETAGRIASYRPENSFWTLRSNRLRISNEEMEALLSRKVWQWERTPVAGAWRIRGAMNIGNDADFTSGLFSIQSLSSQMVCLAMEVRPGNRVLDCCAAPGGKACFLAELMGNTGRVQAWDVHEHRVKLIEAQVRRLGLENVRPMIRDALKRRDDLIQSMDAVLLDAPCSALGLLAEKPDLRLRLTAEKIEELVKLQEELLNTVCEYVRPGGTLVYSTCSVLPEENEEQIKRFLTRHPEFEAVPLPDVIPEQFRQYQRIGLQLLEYRDGTEGFYLCRMKRKDDSI